MVKAPSSIAPILLIVLILLSAPAEAKLQGIRNRRRGIKGNKGNERKLSKIRELVEEMGRDKNDKDVAEVVETPPRYSFPSKILSESENEFLGAQRFVGEVCLCSIDTVDFRYRSDFLVEAWDIDSSTSLGYCLDFSPAEDEDEKEKEDQSTPFLTMSECDKNAPGQRWFFNRVATPDGDSTNQDRRLYIIQNAASGLVLAAPPDPPLFTDDKDSPKDEWRYYDDDKYTPDYISDLDNGIHLTQLSRVDMEQDKILWAINEERFFTFQDRGFFDFFDDDIFGYFDDLSTLVASRQHKPTGDD